ncbi:MAG: ABC transporter permease, partial [Kitasatospora sp.]|nr:ABC transporter permease [Kitasatospora sp.]
MTAVATRAPAAPVSTGGRRSLAGTGTLLKLALRRDRIVLPVWVYVLVISVVSSAYSFKGMYDTAAERARLAHDMTGNGAMRAMFGPVFDDSLGGLVSWRLTTFMAAFAGVMSLIIVVRHTRDEEESGRQELLSSAMVGRRAPLTAALTAAALANVLTALLIGAGMAAVGQPAAGSFALGFAIGGAGLVFAGVAAVAAQLTESGRLAKGVTAAVIGAAFVLRGAGDSGTADGGSPLTWLSPIGWAEHVRPFAGERWWVLLVILAAAGAVSYAGYLLADRRDLGA